MIPNRPYPLLFRQLFPILAIPLLVLASFKVTAPTTTIDKLVIESSRKIVRKGLYEAKGYCRVHWKVTPLGLGGSDGKGIQVLFQNKKDVFIAIGDDAPIAMYDSELRKVVASNQAAIKVGKTMEFVADILPTGIVVYQRNGTVYEEVMRYAKTIPDRFSLFMACQRTGATFEDVWVKKHESLDHPVVAP